MMGLKVYKMPNGRKYQFDENNVPDGAVLVEKKAKEKAAAKKPNKAKKAANKSKKVSTK